MGKDRHFSPSPEEDELLVFQGKPGLIRQGDSFRYKSTRKEEEGKLLTAVFSHYALWPTSEGDDILVVVYQVEGRKNLTRQSIGNMQGLRSVESPEKPMAFALNVFENNEIDDEWRFVKSSKLGQERFITVRHMRQNREKTFPERNIARWNIYRDRIS